MKLYIVMALELGLASYPVTAYETREKALEHVHKAQDIADRWGDTYFGTENPWDPNTNGVEDSMEYWVSEISLMLDLQHYRLQQG